MIKVDKVNAYRVQSLSNKLDWSPKWLCGEISVYGLKKIVNNLYSLHDYW